MSSNRLFWLLTISIFQTLLPVNPVQAHDKVVVIPLFGSNKPPIKNVITVAKNGGDYTSLASAVNSITDSSEDNPYLVYIAPGVYNVSENTVIHGSIHVVGSGVGVTYLKGAISKSDTVEGSSVVKLELFSKISSLSIENTSDGSYSSGVYVSGGIRDVYIENISIDVSGSGNLYGMYCLSSNVSVKDVDITNTGGDQSYGIYISSLSQPVISDVEVKITEAASARGIFNVASRPDIKNTNIKVSSSGSSYGIYNTEMSKATVSSTYIEAKSDGTSYAIHNNGESSSTVRHSYLYADSCGVFSHSSSYGLSASHSTDMVNIVNKIQFPTTSFFIANNERLVNIFQPTIRGGVRV